MATILNGVTANGSSALIEWTGGTGTFWAWGAFGGATVTLEASPDGAHWIAVGSAVSFIEDGIGAFSLSPCKLRATVSGATASTNIYASA